MNDEKGIRIVVQAVGVYSVVHALSEILQQLARYFSWLLLKNDTVYPRIESFRPYMINSAIQCALLLIPAWVLLVKTDWCVRTVVSLSSRRTDEASEDEDEEQSA